MHEPALRAAGARPATPDDAPAVVDLVEAAYRGDASRRGWTTEADLLDGRRTDARMVGRILDDPASVLLVLDDPERPGALVACCHLEHRGDAAYFGLFAVRPDAQAQGVGSRLLDAAESLARGRGASRLELTVLSHRPELAAWYERRGFATTGATHPFPGYTDTRFGLPRRGDLVLHEMVKPLR